MTSTETETVLPHLTEAAGGALREGGPEDHVDGMPCRWVVSPRDTAQVAAVMRVADAAGLAVVPRGSASKLGWGAPPERLDVLLDLRALDTLVEHAAGDLITVVGAGRRLDDLQGDLAGSGQWLAVEPSRSGTVGGLVATACTGPTRLLHGPVRDLVIGTTMVRADGVVARSGGKVVKNVAGYDLGKLLTGSFGTLGVVTEVAFRLHPVADAHGWVSVPTASAQHAHALVQGVIHSHLVATACELDRPADGPAALAVRLDGIAPGVAARTAAALTLLGEGATALEVAPPWWGSEPGEPDEVLLKVTHEISGLPALLDVVDAAADRSSVPIDLRGSVAVGTVLARLRGTPDRSAVATVVEDLRAGAPRFGGTVVVLEADPDTKRTLDVWGPVKGLDLMHSVKRRLDPGRTLSPGRFVGGI